VSIRMTDKATGKWWAEYRYMGAKWATTAG
jgi:hypothetical protein